MEINHIQNYYRLQNASDAGRAKKMSDGAPSEVLGSYGKDEVAISSEASFKAALSTYAKVCASQKKQEASVERIEELKAAYAGDSCPVAGRDIAAAVIKYTFGADILEQKGR